MGLRLLRSAVSYLPDPSLLRLRALSDLALRGRPHETDFDFFAGMTGDHVVLDVGANRGQTIRSIGIVLPSAKVVAVEPNPVLAGALSGSGRYRAETVHHAALSDAIDGSLELWVPRYGHTLYDTRAASSADHAREFLGPDHFLAFRPSRAGVERFEAPITTMDSLDVEPTIIKIDVEGADAAVVAGGMETIRRCQPVLMIEEPSADTIKMLTDEGYELGAYENGSITRGRTGALNTFFLPPGFVGTSVVDGGTSARQTSEPTS